LEKARRRREQQKQKRVLMKEKIKNGIKTKVCEKEKKAKLKGAFVEKEKFKQEENDITHMGKKILENKEVNDTNQVVDIKKSGLVKREISKRTKGE